MSTSAAEPRRFRVALSFAGEYRDRVKQIADKLKLKLGEDAVFYDDDHNLELAKPNLDTDLPNLYRTQSDHVLVFLCPEYGKKKWCRLEWRAIKNLIATDDEDRIRFLSFGDPGDLSHLGIYSGDGRWDISNVTAEKVAEDVHRYVTGTSETTPLVKRLGTIVIPAAEIIEYVTRVHKTISLTVVPSGHDQDARHPTFHDWCIEGKVVATSDLLSDHGSSLDTPNRAMTVDEMAAVIGDSRIGRAVVAGEAGQGKSSFLRQLVRRLADPESRSAGVLPPVLPVFVPLNDLDWKADGAADVRKTVTDFIRDRYGLDLARQGTWPLIVWLFDGIEEIPPDAALALCHEFLGRMDDAGVIVAGRPGVLESLAMRGAPLPLVREHRTATIDGPYRVVPWTEAEGKAFVEKFFEGSADSEAPRVAGSLLAMLRARYRFGGVVGEGDASLLSDPLITSYACIRNASVRLEHVTVAGSPAAFFRDLVNTLLARRTAGSAPTDADLHRRCLGDIATEILFRKGGTRSDGLRLTWADACDVMQGALRRHAPQRRWSESEAEGRLTTLIQDAAVIKAWWIASSGGNQTHPDGITFGDVRVLDALAALACAEETFWFQIRAVEAMSARRLFFLEVLAEASRHHWHLFAYVFYRWFPSAERPAGRPWAIHPLLPILLLVYRPRFVWNTTPPIHTIAGRQGLLEIAAIYRARAARAGSDAPGWALPLDRACARDTIEWASRGQERFVWPRSYTDKPPRWHYVPESVECIRAIWEANPIVLSEQDSMDWWRWNQDRNAAIDEPHSGEPDLSLATILNWLNPRRLLTRGLVTFNRHDRGYRLLGTPSKNRDELDCHRAPEDRSDYDHRVWRLREVLIESLRGNVAGLRTMLAGSPSWISPIWRPARFPNLGTAARSISNVALFIACVKVLASMASLYDAAEFTTPSTLMAAFVRSPLPLLTAAIAIRVCGSLSFPPHDAFDDQYAYESSTIERALDTMQAIGVPRWRRFPSAHVDPDTVLADLLRVSDSWRVEDRAWTFVIRNVEDGFGPRVVDQSIRDYVKGDHPATYAQHAFRNMTHTTAGLRNAFTLLRDIDDGSTDPLRVNVWEDILSQAHRLNEAEIAALAASRIEDLTGKPAPETTSGSEFVLDWVKASSPNDLTDKQAAMWTAYQAFQAGDFDRCAAFYVGKALSKWDLAAVLGVAFYTGVPTAPPQPWLESFATWSLKHVVAEDRSMTIVHERDTELSDEIVPVVLLICDHLGGSDPPDSVIALYAAVVRQRSHEWRCHVVWPIVRRLDKKHWTPDSSLGRAYRHTFYPIDPEVRAFMDVALPIDVRSRVHPLAIAWRITATVVPLIIGWLAAVAIAGFIIFSLGRDRQ